MTESLAQAARRHALPYVPGVATPTEALAAREHGFYELKFFPFELAGGLKWLRHVEPLYPDLRFCPTGGIDARNAREVMSCPNVFAVGGAYPAPKPLIDAADWRAIGALAEEAVQAVT
jgi:2-dehydro-3-deoxyphosphogluconate aldolase/(4S)-4-hydroxy-2-oxoglutarate aldolase